MSIVRWWEEEEDEDEQKVMHFLATKKREAIIWSKFFLLTEKFCETNFIGGNCTSLHTHKIVDEIFFWAKRKNEEEDEKRWIIRSEELV